MPVLLLSAKSRDSDVDTGFAVGADDYVIKPFSPGSCCTGSTACSPGRDERRGLVIIGASLLVGATVVVLAPACSSSCWSSPSVHVSHARLSARRCCSHHFERR